jgi:hypothetical protein
MFVNVFCPRAWSYLLFLYEHRPHPAWPGEEVEAENAGRVGDSKSAIAALPKVMGECGSCDAALQLRREGRMGTGTATSTM